MEVTILSVKAGPGDHANLTQTFALAVLVDGEQHEFTITAYFKEEFGKHCSVEGDENFYTVFRLSDRLVTQILRIGRRVFLGEKNITLPITVNDKEWWEGHWA